MSLVHTSALQNKRANVLLRCFLRSFESVPLSSVMFTAAILFCFGVTSIYAHGYLVEPVARSSAWLVDPSFKPCCTYEGHMEMFCGGVGHQWNSNGNEKVHHSAIAMVSASC